jgi:hypothetical protein
MASALVDYHRLPHFVVPLNVGIQTFFPFEGGEMTANIFGGKVLGERY